MPKTAIYSNRVHRSELPFAQATLAGGFMYFKATERTFADVI